LSLGCQKDAPLPAKEDPHAKRPAQPADAGPSDAALRADAGSPARKIPPKLAAAPARILRLQIAGALPPNTTTTYELRTVDGDALLTVSTQRPKGRRLHFEAITEWAEPVTETFIGKTTPIRGGTGFEFESGQDTLWMHCRTSRPRVAVAKAFRHPTPYRSKPDEEPACGLPGIWSLKRRVRIQGLSCDVGVNGASRNADGFDFRAQRRRDEHSLFRLASHNGPAGGVQPHEQREYPCNHFQCATDLLFATPPGVEWAYVNDDCVMQGGDYRAVPADGSILPTHHYPR